MNKKFWSILLVIMLSVVAVVMIVSKTDQIAPEDPSSAVKIFEPPASIEQLTEDRRIANYLKQHHRLPHFYITKKQARELGWDARKGNLCQILPGKAIGGDLFSNRERQLPEARGRIWHEADVNYKCGHRGSERLLYSNDGLIYLTQNHYKNFVLLESIDNESGI